MKIGKQKAVKEQNNVCVYMLSKKELNEDFIKNLINKV